MNTLPVRPKHTTPVNDQTHQEHVNAEASQEATYQMDQDHHNAGTPQPASSSATTMSENSVQIAEERTAMWIAEQQVLTATSPCHQHHDYIPASSIPRARGRPGQERYSANTSKRRAPAPVVEPVEPVEPLFTWEVVKEVKLCGIRIVFTMGALMVGAGVMSFVTFLITALDGRN